MLPEWIWAIIVGSVVIGMVIYIWNTRNQGFITESKHTETCGKTKEGINMDINKISQSFKDTLSVQYQGIMELMKARFEGLDDKIENIVLKEIRLIGNGHGNGRGNGRGHAKPAKLKRKKQSS